jgi:hypothetical protein
MQPATVPYSKTNLSPPSEPKGADELSKRVIILHDNARPHSAGDVFDGQDWEVLSHPPHSPDLSPCDFHLFGPLKEYQEASGSTPMKRLWKRCNLGWGSQPKELFATGSRRLTER